jgi:hypothetical protein
MTCNTLSHRTVVYETTVFVIAEQQALALLAARAVRDYLICHLMHAFFAARSARLHCPR